MIAAGGNIYYLAKLAGIFGLNVQDVGSMQTGVSVETFQGHADGAGRRSII
jgi:protocatechuate 4,5-dioxygenase alpha chain